MACIAEDRSAHSILVAKHENADNFEEISIDRKTLLKGIVIGLEDIDWVYLTGNMYR